MSLRIRLSRAARADADEAQAYYAEISAQLGDGFTDELLEALALLVAAPHIGSRRYAHFTREGGLRFWRLDRYPFLLFYRIHDDVLDVVRLVHERRHITRSLLRVK